LLFDEESVFRMNFRSPDNYPYRKCFASASIVIINAMTAKLGPIDTGMLRTVARLDSMYTPGKR